MVPEGWRAGKVLDFFKLQRGFDLTKASSTSGRVPVYSSSGLSYYHNEAKVNGPGIVTGRKGSVGAIHLIHEDFWPHDTTLWVCDFMGNDVLYVWYFLHILNLDRLDEASSVPTLNRNNVHALRCVFPPLAEQKRIAEVLGVWDRAIAVAGQQLDLARTQKRALMQTLLTPTRRFPGFDGQPWKDLPFNAVFERIKRKNTVGNENVLTISGQDGLVSQSDYFNKRVAAKDLSGYTLLHGGDFAYNKSYSNGYPMGAIKVLPDGQSGVVSSLYLCFRIMDETRHSRDFFRHYFEAGRHDQEISLIAQEGARNHGLLNVGVSAFFETYLHVPDYPEQCRIADVIGAAEDAERHAQTQITRLQAEKKALMQQLLTGKKRI